MVGHCLCASDLQLLLRLLIRPACRLTPMCAAHPGAGGSQAGAADPALHAAGPGAGASPAAAASGRLPARRKPPGRHGQPPGSLPGPILPPAPALRCPRYGLLSWCRSCHSRVQTEVLLVVVFSLKPMLAAHQYHSQAFECNRHGQPPGSLPGPVLPPPPALWCLQVHLVPGGGQALLMLAAPWAGSSIFRLKK